MMKPVRMQIATSDDIIQIRRKGREMALSAGLGAADQTRFATALSEITRNVVQYAGSGVCDLIAAKRGTSASIRAVVEDNGPGIDNLEEALTGGFSKGAGIGAGLPGAKRLVTFFDIESKPGKTRVVLEIKRKLGVFGSVAN